MSWLYSQVLVEEYLGDISLDGEQSVQSSGKPTQLAYLSQDKMTKYSRLSRFGMMFKPLTESLGKELLMLYLEDFHARTSALLDRGGGITASRSSMWKHMARIIGEVRPRYCFVENSPMLTTRGLGTVLGDLASLGFDAEWGVLSAADVGANHKRKRIWIVANSISQRWKRAKVNTGIKKCRPWENKQFARLLESSEKLAIPTSSNCGIHDGVAARMDRLKAIGNGQVPLCAATAWRLLSKRLDE